MKLLFIGDIHSRPTNPRNRKDNYAEALRAKLLECWEIAKTYDVAAVIQPGDIFHTPETTIRNLLDMVDILKKCPVTFYTTPGNHDLFGYSLESFPRTSLHLLDLLCDNVHVSLDKFPAYGLDAIVDFRPYVPDIDSNREHYQIKKALKILVIHGMLLDHNLPYEARYTNLYHLETNADIILSGHDHIGYGVIKRKDSKLFVNPGALMRLTASEAEMRRPVQVAVIDTETRTAELVPLKTARPAEEVLDRSKLEAKQERIYAMEEFAALIKTSQGATLQNLDEIVTTIGKQEAVSDEIVQKAVELLREVKT